MCVQKRFIQLPRFVSTNRPGDITKACEERGAHKHFHSAESFIAARDVFFCSPIVQEGKGAFSISRKAIIGVATPIRQHVNEHASHLRASRVTLYRRQFRNIGNLSVSRSCSAQRRRSPTCRARDKRLHHPPGYVRR